MSDDDCPELISAKVPVTILTGFLGSGKTTLIHYILTAEHNLRIAVIVNEFEFGRSIEKGLTLRSSEKPDDEWLELNNGCMCCTAQTQTVMALESLMKRKGTFDLILVETAGLADPGPVASMFWQDESLCGVLYLSGIVTLVDAANICKYLNDDQVSQEANRQILMADKVILNKCDITTAEQQEAALQAVQTINPAAPVLPSSYSQVPNLRNILFIDTTRTFVGFEHIHATHASSITAVSLEFSEPGAMLAVSSVRDVDMICKELLYKAEDYGFEVIRCKAAIWMYMDGTYTLLQLQSIGALFDVTPMEGFSVPPGCTRALVLGKHLDEAKIRSIFLEYLKPAVAAITEEEREV